MPAHIIATHLDKLLLDGWQPDHYIMASIPVSKDKLWFLYCLTCKKGMMSDGSEGHGARWISVHDKKTNCKKAHKEALAVLRMRYSEAKGIISTIPTPPVTITTPISIPLVDPIKALWEECKRETRMRPITDKAEADCKQLFEMDCEGSDDDTPVSSKEFIFDPSEGFRAVVRMVIRNSKDITKMTENIRELEHKSDRTRIELTDKLETAEKKIKNMLEFIHEQYERLTAQEAKIARLEKINGIYRDKHPELEENPQ
jgi:hypothetical protein